MSCHFFRAVLCVILFVKLFYSANENRRAELPIKTMIASATAAAVIRLMPNQISANKFFSIFMFFFFVFLFQLFHLA